MLRPGLRKEIKYFILNVYSFFIGFQWMVNKCIGFVLLWLFIHYSSIVSENILLSK